MTQGSSTARGAACREIPGKVYGVQRGTPAPGARGRTDTAEPPRRTSPCPGHPPGALTTSSWPGASNRLDTAARHVWPRCPAPPRPLPWESPSSPPGVQLPSALSRHRGSSRRSHPGWKGPLGLSGPSLHASSVTCSRAMGQLPPPPAHCSSSCPTPQPSQLLPGWAGAEYFRGFSM